MLFPKLLLIAITLTTSLAIPIPGIKIGRKNGRTSFSITRHRKVGNAPNPPTGMAAMTAIPNASVPSVPLSNNEASDPVPNPILRKRSPVATTSTAGSPPPSPTGGSRAATPTSPAASTSSGKVLPPPITKDQAAMLALNHTWNLEDITNECSQAAGGSSWSCTLEGVTGNPKKKFTGGAKTGATMEAARAAAEQALSAVLEEAAKKGQVTKLQAKGKAT